VSHLERTDLPPYAAAFDLLDSAVFLEIAAKAQQTFPDS
jgi:hypothetical protein